MDRVAAQHRRAVDWLNRRVFNRILIISQPLTAGAFGRTKVLSQAKNLKFYSCRVALLLCLLNPAQNGFGNFIWCMCSRINTFRKVFT